MFYHEDQALVIYIMNLILVSIYVVAKVGWATCMFHISVIRECAENLI